MLYQSKVEKFKELQEYILEYLENPEGSAELFQTIINFNFESYDFTHFLFLLSKIASNHNHCPNFFTNIDQLLHHFKDRIKQSLSNIEIYKLFQKSKRTLLYLFEDQIITRDQEIINHIKTDSYFQIYLEAKDEGDNMKKLLEGENDSYICSLIRKDSVEEFVQYVNSANINLFSLISKSKFETNRFLMKQAKTSLIEYAAFFGSVQIFNFLKMSNVELVNTLYQYAIHSNNPEILYSLESISKESINENNFSYLKKMIKCHHNNFANYLMANYMDEKDLKSRIQYKFRDNNYFYAFHYYNYAFYPETFDECDFIFYYLCMNRHFDIVKDYLESEKLSEVNLRQIIHGEIFIII